VPVGSVVFLEQYALVENEAHPRSRDAASGLPAREHIPVSDPEIELPVLGRGASLWFDRLRAARIRARHRPASNEYSDP
jgi:hypothetical protein